MGKIIFDFNKKDEHPLRLVELVTMNIFIDQGMDPADEPPFALVEKFEDDTEIDWQRVEKFLATLSEENLIEFSIGEDTDVKAIADRGGAEGEYAHRALDALFMSI